MSINTLTEAFKEFYYIGSLPESDEKLYYLIRRYQHKVSYRLLQKKKDLYQQGKELFQKELKEAVCRPNPFLEILKKHDQDEFAGKYHPVPVI